jgi:hypothetical protein
MTDTILKSVSSTLPKITRDTAATERARLVAAARADVTLVRKRKAEIASAFYEIGKALTRLRCDPVPKLLGFRTFRRLCMDALGMSLGTAEKLMQIVERVSPKNALRWGKEKAAALVDLANAVGSVRRISRNSLSLDPERATTREIRAEARKQRAHRSMPSSRGRSIAPSERLLAERLERALHGAGVTTARTRAVAGVPGKPATLRIERIPFDKLGSLKKALSTIG